MPNPKERKENEKTHSGTASRSDAGPGPGRSSGSDSGSGAPAASGSDLGGEEPAPAGDKTVDSAAVTTQPEKTEYLVGETFDGTGGKITVTYTDGSTEEIDMTADGVTNNLNTEKVGKKSVSIYYNDVKCSKTVNVTVVKESLSVTLHYNCDEKADESYDVDKGATIVEPALPDRSDGFQFVGWFTDEGFASEYDFSAEVTAPVELFAKWLDLSEGAYKFTYIYNYDGAPQAEYSTYNTTGVPVARVEDPERTGYAFLGWFLAEDGGDEFDFAVAPDEDTTVYAQWEKTAEGVNEYVFEVENADLSTKTGAGLSGTTSKGGMLVKDSTHGASGDLYLSYQYITGNSVDFVICADEAVDDVTFVARLSQEARDYTYNKSNYSISVNGEALDYDDIVFTDVPAFSADGADPVDFQDYTIATGLSLNKGRNTITFTVINSDALTGTTMNAASPLLDCIKLSTEAVLIWDGSMGLPMKW